ncbi:MAG: YIP1 family protein [Bacteroides sp.]|nr:YIP1 family protein [Bacteroides sp.]
MNYKELFNRVLLLISSPAKAWEEIKAEEDKKGLLSAFVYPMIGFCGLSVFIGTFIGNTAGVSAFQIAMTRCCAVFVSLFGGFFLAAYLLDLVGQKLFGRLKEQDLIQQFVGYSMVVIFILNIFSGLFSLSILHWILQFYTVFVVYEGARLLLNVAERDLTRYALIASVIIILSPELISVVFDKLSLILN